MVLYRDLDLRHDGSWGSTRSGVVEGAVKLRKIRTFFSVSWPITGQASKNARINGSDPRAENTARINQLRKRSGAAGNFAMTTDQGLSRFRSIPRGGEIGNLLFAVALGLGSRNQFSPRSATLKTVPQDCKAQGFQQSANYTVKTVSDWYLCQYGVRYPFCNLSLA